MGEQGDPILLQSQPEPFPISGPIDAELQEEVAVMAAMGRVVDVAGFA